MSVKVIRRPETLVPDDDRVIARYFDLHSRRRVRALLSRIMRLSDEQVSQLLPRTMASFSSRHRDIRAVLLDNYEAVARYGRLHSEPSDGRRLLIGAYFTMEYSIESAALFNPSIVRHPDQSELSGGQVRFLMSLRATGEGHVSSIVFRRGVLSAQGEIAFDPPPRFAYCARAIPRSSFDKPPFVTRLRNLGVPEEVVAGVLAGLPDRFSLEQLQRAVEEVNHSSSASEGFNIALADILWSARASYELHYPEECRPSEIVIFPATERERRGMEDLRLVCFRDEGAGVRYYGTYTAFDGFRTLPMMIETSDFTDFQVSPLRGRYARNKGLALFPRKVGGRYVMVSRHDGENLHILTSDNVHVWNEGSRLYGPTEPWELVQVGNCGSPLETEAGWLLLTHGVGPLREYCIGALLLDRDQPSRVLGRLREPLLIPAVSERGGYVPNVVYSCGSMIHRDRLIIPYALSDSRTAFASVAVSELLDTLRDSSA